MVGVALNNLDSAKAGVEFINNLTNNGLNVRLRWHPGQPPRDIEQYREAFANSKRVTLSNPREEPISDFLERIEWLIAGNSSIHLEAALAGVKPVYYELEPADDPDYYGYVKHGLARSAITYAEILELIESTNVKYYPSTEAVKYYSSTYLTEWESREGELVVECLQRISVDEELPVDVVRLDQIAKPNKKARMVPV